LSARVVSVEGEVQVGLRVTRYECSSEHLSELLNVGFLRKGTFSINESSERRGNSSSSKTHESSDSVDNADEGEHEEREDQGDDESPPRELRSTGVCRNESRSVSRVW
jgi:hypothetical protein